MKDKTKKGRKTPAKRARTSGKDKKKPAPVIKRGEVKPAKRGKRKPTKNPFAGATEISVTENKIAVTRSVSKSVKGAYLENTTREYHDRTPESERAFQEALSGGVKKVTVKLK